jgi:PhnB protein
MSVNPIPAGFHTIAPNIIVKNIDAAVSFYKRAFGAEEILRLSMPDGKVTHCELKFGDSRVNLGESMEGWPEHSLLAQIFVADSDAVFAQAVEAGAEVLSPMTDMFFGSREGRVLDPFGSTWTISTHKENVSVEEMQRRLNALAAWQESSRWRSAIEGSRSGHTFPSSRRLSSTATEQIAVATSPVALTIPTIADTTPLPVFAGERRPGYCAVSVKAAELDIPTAVALMVMVPGAGGSVYD